MATIYWNMVCTPFCNRIFALTVHIIYSMVISCALLKAYRIAVIFHKGAANVSPSDLTDSTLLKYFTAMMIVDVFFLSMYTIFNELDGGSYPRYLDDELLIEIRCNSNALTMVSYSLLVAWQLLLLLFVLKYGNETRSAGKAFKETKCIYVGSNIGSIFFIAFGILVLFTTNYTLQIVVRGYGSLTVVMMTIGLLFMPKWKSVYGETEEAIVEDQDGNKMTEKELTKKREFETQVKEPSGKDLLLLLDVLVRELAYRTDMKMIEIELKSIDLLQCLKFMDDLKALVPQPLQEEYHRQQQQQQQNGNSDDSNGHDDDKEPLQIKQNTVASTSTNLVSENDQDINLENGQSETMPKTSEMKPQKSKSKSSRNRGNSLDSDSHNMQSSPDVNNSNNSNNSNIEIDQIEMRKLNSHEPDDE